MPLYAWMVVVGAGNELGRLCSEVGVRRLNAVPMRSRGPQLQNKHTALGQNTNRQQQHASSVNVKKNYKYA